MAWPSPSPLSFLVSSDPYHAFYLEKRNEYIHQLLDGTVEPPPESVYKSPPVEDFEPPPTRDHPRPPWIILSRITLKQLGVVKLTALFVARYGEHFRRELMLRAVTLPHFEFLFFHPHDKPCTTPPEISFQVFSILVRAYSSVLTPCKKSRKKIDASVLECFFHRLQIEKLGEASDESETAAVMDLHAFVACVDYVAHMDLTEYSDYVPPPERLTVMMNQPTHMHPAVDAYSKVVRVFDGVATETVLERYLWHLKRKKPGEEGVMDMDDLYGFVEGVDCFAQMEDASYSALDRGEPANKNAWNVFLST